MDHATLAALRDGHPAWRLLASRHAPLVASFLHRVFVAPNVRVMGEADLAEALEDEPFCLLQQNGPDGRPKRAQEYLDDWAAHDKGWFRKFYKPGTDEARFDLTPATEKAVARLGPDAEVRNFQQDLRACAEGALTGSADGQYSEVEFLQVKAGCVTGATALTLR